MNTISLLKEAVKHRAAIRSIVGSGNIDLLSDFPPGHYYSPIPDRNDLLMREPVANPPQLPGIDLNVERQVRLLGQLAPLATQAGVPAAKTPGRRYHLDNPFYSFGDGLALTGMLQHFRPKRIVEVGSGYSSAAMLDTNDRQMERSIEFTFIDPEMDRLTSLLAPHDRQTCTLIPHAVQAANPDVFRQLGPNDLLFIDSSHVAKHGSDVCHLLFHVLPALKQGVVIHIHDIFWPFEYPKQWLLGGRIWNEAYVVRAFLEYNSEFEILLFNAYLAEQHRELVARLLPQMLQPCSYPDTFGNSSLWLRKHSSAD